MRHVVVVGAGPAGLAAAVAAADTGARVTLLDATDHVGGQYWRHLPSSRAAAAEQVLHHRGAQFRRLRDRVQADPAVELVTEAQVWALDQLDEGLRLHVLIGPPDGAGRAGRVIEPDGLVLATGAHDRTLPFPGWHLPGVTTAGAAQALAKGERVAVGRRVVVAGAGPFLLPVASSLLRTGADVLSVHEASRPGTLARGWLARPWELAGAAGKAGELAGYVRDLVRHRVPWQPGEAVVAAHGDRRVEAVTVARLDAAWAPVPATEREVEADAVCVSHGFTPRLELAVAAGCDLSPGRFVVVDADQAATTPGVWAAGEITGIGGVEAALAEGAVAGHAAAGGEADGTRADRAARRTRRRADGFAARIQAAHGTRPGWTGWLTDDTVVCRCEETRYGRLRATAAATASYDVRSAKLTTRAGLGPCQARICGRTVQELLGDTSTAVERRPVVVPVRLGELVAIPDLLAAPAPSETTPSSSPQETGRTTP